MKLLAKEDIVSIPNVKLQFRVDFEPLVDWDLSVFILGKDNKVVSEDCFVYYNNIKSPDGAIWLYSDLLEFENDPEFIGLDLGEISTKAVELAFSAYNHQLHSKKHLTYPHLTFELIDFLTAQPYFKHIYDDKISSCASIELCRIYKDEGEWKLQVTGVGHRGGLEELVNKFM